MNCKHVETLTYSLMSSDVKDFTKRLDERKKESDHGLGVSFLTPNMRSNRAKSMLATTKTSTSGGGGTSGSKLFDIETDCEFPSGDHRRSSVRKRKPLCAPTKFQNCTSCGALYFRVSKPHFKKKLAFLIADSPVINLVYLESLGKLCCSKTATVLLSP